MNGFVSGPYEPGLEHFSQWLDHIVRRSPDVRGGMLGAILGTAWGLGGAGVGILAGGLQIASLWALTPLFFSLAATFVGIAWYAKGRTEQERAMAEMLSRSKGVVWQLHNARWRSQLRTNLGAPAIELLEDGARSWTRAKAAFSSPLWEASSVGGAHSEARDHAVQAMDSAMARLALLAGIGGYDEGPGGPAHKLVADMRQMAEEAQRLIERLGERTIVDSGQTSRDLREALAELKMLTTAEEELRELKERDA